MFSLSSGQIIARAIGIVTTAYIARIIGPEGLGTLGFAAAMVSYFGLMVNLGFDAYGTREIAKHKKELTAYVNNIFTIRFIISILVYLVFFIVITSISKSELEKNVLLINGLIILINVVSLNWVYQGIERMEIIALAQILNSLLYMVGLFVFVKSQNDLLKVVIVMIITLGISALWVLILYSKKFNMPRFQVDFQFWKKMLKASLPMALSSLMIAIYYNMDMVMLGFMKDAKEVGYYNAAYKIIFILASLQYMVNQTIYPSLSKMVHTNEIALEKFANSAMKIMNNLSLVVITIIIFLSLPITNLLYGNEFQQSSGLLKILIFSTFLVYNETITAPLLLSLGKQTLHLLAVSIGAFLNIILNVFLIPRYGAMGAAWATVMAEIVVFSLLLYFAFKHVRIEIFRIFFPSIIFIPFLLFTINLTSNPILPSVIMIFLMFLIFFSHYSKKSMKYLIRFNMND